MFETLGRLVRQGLSPVGRVAALAVSVVRDAFRSPDGLKAENVLLRAQLAALKRQVRRAAPDANDRTILAALSRLVPRWRSVMLLVKPETVIAWHKQIARWIWAWKSRPKRRRAPSNRTPDDLRALVIAMAEKSPRWGPKRIVGELLKLHFVVSERTVTRILRRRWPNGRDRGQSWQSFVRNHLVGTWACDFFTVTTIAFKQLYVFFVMDLETRRIVHANVTDAPSSEWTTQQIRNATLDKAPKRLIRDRDGKFVEAFDAVIENAGGEVLLSPPRTPTANSFAERLVGTWRREVFDHVVPRDEQHARDVIKDFEVHYLAGRPHQGIAQQTPAEVGGPPRLAPAPGFSSGGS